MGKLPFPAKLKSGYIKTAGHSRWLYGSEVAPPNKKAFNYLRTAVVNTVFPKKNRMRCPLLTMSTWDNVWVDPWAIWVSPTWWQKFFVKPDRSNLMPFELPLALQRFWPLSFGNWNGNGPTVCPSNGRAIQTSNSSMAATNFSTMTWNDPSGVHFSVDPQ